MSIAQLEADYLHIRRAAANARDPHGPSNGILPSWPEEQ